MQDSLKYIYTQQKELSCFGGIGALLGWDQMTYMPPKAHEDRAEQLALISKLSHERVISDEFFHHLTTLHNNTSKLSEIDNIVVSKLYKDIEKARKIPTAFVETMTKTTAHAYAAWEDARTQKKFTMFAPHLEKIVDLQRQYIDYIKLPGHPYNSLLDDYEEGMTVDILRHQFSTLRQRLTKLLENIMSSPQYHRQQPLAFTIPVEHQQQLCTTYLRLIQFPADRSRLDVSTHPFSTTLGDDDIRLTTNYSRGGPLFSLFSTIHEAGHGLYELGLPKDQYKDTVISDATSLGIHESQSRFWENMIAHNRPFWDLFAPQFNSFIPTQLKHSAEHWYTLVNQVRPSCIRIEADELTYGLHVILRFELELQLLEGKTTVRELPQVWNDTMKQFLGITPTNDVEGVLQDMHWSTGEFGYFPTYAIGTIYAAQLYKQLLMEQPTIPEEIRQGQFTTILSWLHDHVHHYGRLFTAEEIIKKSCGQGLNADVFLSYLTEKYTALYDI